MAERIKPIVPQIISIEQDGFVKGKQIMNRIIQMHEVLNSIHNKKYPTMVVKLDMEKAYDRESWSFLDLVLEQFRFEETWRKWIT